MSSDKALNRTTPENFMTTNEIGEPRSFSVDKYDVMMTCSACPEQYDVYKGANQVGYLRLRHGSFRAEYPDCGGKEVYYANTGYGDFENDKDRAVHILKAIIAINKEVEKR